MPDAEQKHSGRDAPTMADRTFIGAIHIPKADPPLPENGTFSGLLFPLSLRPAGDHFSTRPAGRKPNGQGAEMGGSGSSTVGVAITPAPALPLWAVLLGCALHLYLAVFGSF